MSLARAQHLHAGDVRGLRRQSVGAFFSSIKQLGGGGGGGGSGNGLGLAVMAEALVLMSLPRSLTRRGQQARGGCGAHLLSEFAALHS